MSRLQQKPILHGRDHLPGAPDPIPGLITGPAGTFQTVVEAIPDLYAYWRLGETGQPWADTSGLAPQSDLTEHASGTALTPDVTGALPAGQDDGAVELNYDGIAESGGRSLRSGAVDKDFDFTGTGELSVCAWVNVKASALTRRGLIIGTSFWSIGTSSRIGWGLQVTYPGRAVRFTYGQPGGGSEVYAETAGGVTAGDWTFFVGTYDGTTIRLYANGVLVDDNPGGFAPAPNTYISLGLGFDGPSSSTNANYFYGTIDEAAVWTRALTAAEIIALYNSGVEGAGAGQQVLLSDGSGGTYWGQVPEQALEDDAVTTSKIADGTIADADVAAAADIAPTKLQHPGGTSSFLRADGTWATPTATSNPATDTSVWMPLTTTVGTDDVLVFDASHQLIPTLTPI